ncbi:MAG TPA: peptidoglycan-associated lipoprotein Pal [Rhodocyclaceae bacterium]|nr:peptidoglycan-associated lipoprotein Pal [Rhodocyclaceae bacterium]
MKIALPMSILLVATLAACSTTPTQEPAPVAPAAPAAKAAPAPAPAPAPKDPFAELKDPKSLLSTRNVYFDYNSYEVKLDYFPLVEAHAKFVKKNPTAHVLIQGNADERGSSEYNLALGQKRAEAVRASMKVLGLKDDQIEAVSLGKEKPKNPGHDEAAWAENRRADILYKGEY